MQACEAIAEAHGLGIVHRDLKPANLFCVRGSDGQASIKVLDFGISKVLDATGLHSPGEMTKTSVVVGSPFYMSPEQMQAPRTVDARTDIWSMGVILYELLAGIVPFPGETLPQISVHVAKSQPTSIASSGRGSSALESVIARCPRRREEARERGRAGGGHRALRTEEGAELRRSHSAHVQKRERAPVLRFGAARRGSRAASGGGYVAAVGRRDHPRLRCAQSPSHRGRSCSRNRRARRARRLVGTQRIACQSRRGPAGQRDSAAAGRPTDAPRAGA